MSLKNKFFKIIFILSLCLWGFNLYRLDFQITLFTVTFVFLSVLYGVILIFGLIPWYGLKYKGLGIEDHFEKIGVAVTYLMLLLNALLVFGIKISFLNILFSVLFSALIVLNGVLLSYHFKDKDKTSPGYFTTNRYLE